MKKKLALGLALAVAVSLAPAPGAARHNADVHSDNIKLVTTWDHDGTYRFGSDLAFWGRRAVLGNFQNPGGFRLVDITKPSQPKFIGQFICPGNQADVSIWKDLVFVSVDEPRTTPECNSGAATDAQVAAGTHWEGLRVVSIKYPFQPAQIAAVNTDCGSHTHTIFPDLKYRDPATGQLAPRLLVYVLSYPIRGQGPKCNLQSHRKVSIVEVPLGNPAAARVVATPSVAPAIGCHDVTYFPKRGLAAAACISESQIWDMSNLTSPRIIAHIENPGINIHHSTALSWDGNTLVIGVELGGAVAAPGCEGQGDSPVGALWFYDVSNPGAPRLAGSYKIPQREGSDLCTAHNFNVVPLRGGRDILVAAWYDGGTTVLEFTDPANPVQLAYYIAKSGRRSTAFASYWYNKRIYVNNYEHRVQSRGFDVLRIRDRFVKRSLRLPFMNPQTQIPPPRPKKKNKKNKKKG